MQVTEQTTQNNEIEMREIERKQEVEKLHSEELEAGRTTKQQLMVLFSLIEIKYLYLMPLITLPTVSSFRSNW